METLNNIQLLKPMLDQAEFSEKLFDLFVADLGLVLRRYSGTDLSILDPGKGLKNTGPDSIPILLTGASFKDSYQVPVTWISALDPGRTVCILRSEKDVDDLPEHLRSAFIVALDGVNEGSSAYWSGLLDIASWIRLRVSRSYQENGKKEGPQIYLAQAVPDVTHQRNILKRELTEHGLRVVPGQDLRYLGPEVGSHVHNLVDQSILAIHPLGNSYGEPGSGSGKSIAELQFDFVTEYLEAIENDPVHAEKGIKRLIWIDPEFNPSDQRQEEFVQKLRRNIEKLRRTEIIQTPLELFKTLVIKRVGSEEREPAPETGSGDGQLVYIISSREENEPAGRLARVIESKGYQSGVLNFSDDNMAMLNEHKRLLKACAGAVVLYGNGNRAWLRSKIMDLLKAPGLGRGRTLEMKQILAYSEDILDDYPLPSGIKIMRDKDIEKAGQGILETLKAIKT